ncbi:MAG: response regulator [Chloroflexota bacterium]
MRLAGAGTPGFAVSGGNVPHGDAGPTSDGPAAANTSPESPERASLRVPRILVVDDEPAIRRFVADSLRGAGYEVMTAASGRDALAIVYEDNGTPALLVTDIEMPAMTGVELAARVRADRPAIRVVLMTGREASAARAREREGLVEGVLLKPFGLAELLDAVFEAIGAPAGT